jgi:hypothetical protein
MVYPLDDPFDYPVVQPIDPVCFFDWFGSWRNRQEDLCEGTSRGWITASAWDWIVEPTDRVSLVDRWLRLALLMVRLLLMGSFPYRIALDLEWVKEEN